jgi:transketolase
MGHLRTSDARISGQRFAAEPGRARRRGAGIDVWMGTIHRKAGRMIGMKTFGASAPLKELQRKFGFIPDSIVTAAKEQVAQGR